MARTAIQKFYDTDIPDSYFEYEELEIPENLRKFIPFVNFPPGNNLPSYFYVRGKVAEVWTFFSLPCFADVPYKKAVKNFRKEWNAICDFIEQNDKKLSEVNITPYEVSAVYKFIVPDEWKSFILEDISIFYEEDRAYQQECEERRNLHKKQEDDEVIKAALSILQERGNKIVIVENDA